eukprot:1850708-Prymnesium_polylepis.1
MRLAGEPGVAAVGGAAHSRARPCGGGAPARTAEGRPRGGDCRAAASGEERARSDRGARRAAQGGRLPAATRTVRSLALASS